MRVLLLTVGTRGDVQPFIALGRGLKQAGHDVSVCTNSSFAPIVEKHDLRYRYLNNDIVELAKGQTGRRAMEEWGGGLLGKFRWIIEATRQFKPIFRKSLVEEWEAAQGAEIVVYSPQAVGGYHIAEALRIPGVMADAVPTWVPTKVFPNFTFPHFKLGGWYNRLTYRLLPVLTRMMYGSVVKKWRREVLRLPPRSMLASDVAQTDGQPVPVLHAFSRHVLPAPSDWPESVNVTGYWFLNETNDWQAPSDLLDFLQAGPPPVFVGFGSMSGRDPGETGRLVIRALEKTGQRGLLATGWGGLESEKLPKNVFQIEAAPYDWLFPRMTAVVHHGGAGTTAAGLRAGKPTVICPFVADQPFWGQRIATLGAGPPPIPQRKLTADNLAAAIEQTITDAEMQRRAAELGEEIREEDGVSNALAFIEDYAAAHL